MARIKIESGVPPQSRSPRPCLLPLVLPVAMATFVDPAVVEAWDAKHAGTYKRQMDAYLDGTGDYPSKCRLSYAEHDSVAQPLIAAADNLKMKSDKSQWDLTVVTQQFYEGRQDTATMIYRRAKEAYNAYMADARCVLIHLPNGHPDPVIGATKVAFWRDYMSNSVYTIHDGVLCALVGEFKDGMTAVEAYSRTSPSTSAIERQAYGEEMAFNASLA